MAPLIVLVIVTLITRAVTGIMGTGNLADATTWTTPLAVGLAAMLCLTASAHFLQPRRGGLIAIVPPSLPRPDALVTATGVLEVAAAIGLCLPATRTLAAWCLAALLVAMFPANIRAARGVDHPDAPNTPLARRTAIQVVFIAAAVAVATIG